MRVGYGEDQDAAVDLFVEYHVACVLMATHALADIPGIAADAGTIGQQLKAAIEIFLVAKRLARSKRLDAEQVDVT